MFNKPMLKFIVLAMVFSLASGFTSAHAVIAKTPHRIVFQVLDDDPVKWVEVLGISKNVQKMLGKENVAIEIVVHGGGIHMVTFESVVASRITAAQKDGVVFAACSQTMKRHNFTAKDLHDGVKIVPIGAVELMQKEEAGWTYIRL